MADWSDVGKSALAAVTGDIEKAVLYVNINKKTNEKTGEILDILGAHKFIVKYNPSTLSIYARAGNFQFAGAGAGGMNQITQLKGDDQISMDVDIILEDLNNLDAFMADAVLGDAGIGQMATSAVSYGLRKAKGKSEYSIQDQAEAFVGLLMSSDYRSIAFSWAKMWFVGELTSVNTQYTMFNPSGHPIRAVVHLTIQQNKGTMNVKYWDEALDALFPEGSASPFDEAANKVREYKDVDARDAQSFVQNLFNI